MVDSFQCADIDRIPDLKKNKFTKMTAIQKGQAIQFYCNISNMMFPVQFSSILILIYLTESVE